MARQVVALGLVFMAVIAMAYVVEASDFPARLEDELAEGPSTADDSFIGISDEGAESPNSVHAAPVGGPVPPGSFTPAAPPSAASALHVSAIAGATAAAVSAFFYF